MPRCGESVRLYALVALGSRISSHALHCRALQVDRLLPRLKTAERMQAALDEDAELVLVEGMVALAPEAEEGEGEEEAALEPMHPADLLTMLVAYMIENIGEGIEGGREGCALICVLLQWASVWGGRSVFCSSGHQYGGGDLCSAPVGISKGRGEICALL